MKKEVIQKGIQHLRKNDKKLLPIIDSVGVISVNRSSDPFQRLSRSIVGQQLSVKAAASIWRRLEDLYPRTKKITPEHILKTPDIKLRNVGMAWAKVAALKDLAEKCSDGTITRSKLAKGNDEEVIELLTTVRGVGLWTAEMYMIFGLGRTDILSRGDAGIIRGIRTIYGIKGQPTERQLDNIAKRWSPYASVASLYVWRHLDAKPK